ncbi:MAG TPA: cytochrome c oxidase assembly factor Coa1 family protein [Luteolibacter sp.]
MSSLPFGPPPIPRPAPPGWWSRHWKWAVPVFAGLSFCLFMALMILFISVVVGSIKSSEPYKAPLAKAVANPQVQAALGTPVIDGFFMSGRINTAGPTGNASLEIPISGPKGKGKLFVEAKIGGRLDLRDLGSRRPRSAGEDSIA